MTRTQMTQPKTHGSRVSSSKPRPPAMFSHVARVTSDAQATVDFYTRVLGMEFVQAVMDDRIPSTGDAVPYFHIFLRLGDGSTIAFFEAPDLPPAGPPPHPAYDTFNHLALQVDSVAEVDDWKRRLIDLGIDVLGPVNHKIIYSIYFRDPVNDLRLEITTPLTSDWNDESKSAHQALADWVRFRSGVHGKGADAHKELSAAIAQRRQQS